jgi:hypothetical protein
MFSVNSQIQSSKQRWAQMAAEGLVIVGSILLAYAIDAWWDDHQSNQEEQEIVAGLITEFKTHRDTLMRVKQAHLERLDHVELILQSSATGQWTHPTVSIDHALTALLIPATTDLGNGVRNALVSGGRLALLSDGQLRLQLANWEGVIDEVSDDENMSRDLVKDMILPYFARHSIPVNLGVAGIDPQGAPRRQTRGDVAAIHRLLRDGEFTTLVETRYAFMSHTVSEYDEALAAIEAILSQLDASRRTR